MAELKMVGKSLPKHDATEKLTGRISYIHDVKLPGMLYGKILYSDRISARIVGIDTSEAEAVPGVCAVITANNTPEIRFGFLKDNVALKKDRVRQYRDEVAAVAATSEEAANEAISKIKVTYEDLPALFDLEEALAEGAPLLHDTDHKGKPLTDNRLRLPWKFDAGDLEAGEQEADFVVEGEYNVGWVTHCCLGTTGCIASFDSHGDLTVHSNTQIPSLAKSDFQEALTAMGLNGRVRVVNAALGGGFGSKLDTYAYEYIAILLAHRTGKPVKILFDRQEEFIATSTRQPMKIRVRQGCTKEGKLTFRDMSLLLDNGAYTSWGATTPSVAMMPATSLYRVPNIRYSAVSVYTNNTYAQAFRGYGNPQVNFAIESNLDELAEAAGIDPLQMRLLNANVAGEVSPQGFNFRTCGHRECLETVANKIHWKDKKESPKPAGPKVRGVGIASLLHNGGGAKIYKSDGCGTIIKMDDTGRVDVFSGSMEIGQGLDTVLRQIVSETLGIPTRMVNIIVGDTDVCPWDVGVHASRSTFVAGNSALGAAKEIKDQILKFAGDMLEAPVEILDIEDMVVVCKEDPSKNIPLEKVLRKAHYSPTGNTMFMATHFYEPPTERPSADFKGDISASYVWGCHGVEVEVDTDTGEVEIVNYVAAHDVGRAINPMLLKGQIHGAVLMGVGYALSEEMIFQHGRLLNPNFSDYRILTATDAIPVEVELVETNDPSGPFGAKGIGEPGLVPTAPAIANAIYNAVGVRIHELPMKPEVVVNALRMKYGKSTDAI
jgi:xanthine dehydrogenase molybdenum-binding subunit